MIMIIVVMTMISNAEDDDKNDDDEMPPVAGSIVSRASCTHTVWKSHLETGAIRKIVCFWHFQCLNPVRTN